MEAPMHVRLTALLLTLAAGATLAAAPPTAGRVPRAVLDDHILLTWYGNPRSTRMGALGEQSGDARVARFEAQAKAYRAVSPAPVLMAYHLVAVVAQCTAGADAMWRRRETRDVIDALLLEARAHDYKVVLDVQVGRSTVAAEVKALEPYLKEPDVYLALDPEFAMTDCQVPGQQVGRLYASDINTSLDVLERLIATHRLPPKILIVHQFRLDMLPDKANVRASAVVDTVLVMDGFGTQALKRSTYRAVMRQPMAYAGIKLFYQQDRNLFTPAQVLDLSPRPVVIVYQ